MNHTWVCPVCDETLFRESLDEGILEVIIMSRQEAMTKLQWDVINHLARHIVNVNLSKGKGGDESRRIEASDATHREDASPDRDIHVLSTTTNKPKGDGEEGSRVITQKVRLQSYDPGDTASAPPGRNVRGLISTTKRDEK